MTWATIPEARALWPDAPSDDPVLQLLLDDATLQLREVAPGIRPTLEPTVAIPSTWKRACVYQARELHLARDRDGDVVGVGDYVIRARPITGSILALLRPERAVPVVG